MINYHTKKSYNKQLKNRYNDTKECAICGQSDYPINEIHHINGKKAGDLIVVCPNCHTMIHKDIIVFGEKKNGNVL